VTECHLWHYVLYLCVNWYQSVTSSVYDTERVENILNLRHGLSPGDKVTVIALAKF